MKEWVRSFEAIYQRKPDAEDIERALQNGEIKQNKGLGRQFWVVFLGVSFASCLLIGYLLVGNANPKQVQSKSSPQEHQKASSSLSSSSSEETTPTSAETVIEEPSMNLSEIASGNYQSISGTWANNRGDVFVFDENGITNKADTVIRISSQNGNMAGTGQLLASVGSSQSMSVGGAAIVFAPKETFFPVGIDGQGDASDSTKERIWIGQQAVYSDPSVFYYRVD